MISSHRIMKTNVGVWTNTMRLCWCMIHCSAVYTDWYHGILDTIYYIWLLLFMHCSLIIMVFTSTLCLPHNGFLHHPWSSSMQFLNQPAERVHAATTHDVAIIVIIVSVLATTEWHYVFHQFVLWNSQYVAETCRNAVGRLFSIHVVWFKHGYQGLPVLYWFHMLMGPKPVKVRRWYKLSDRKWQSRESQGGVTHEGALPLCVCERKERKRVKRRNLYIMEGRKEGGG